LASRFGVFRPQRGALVNQFRALGVHLKAPALVLADFSMLFCHFAAQILFYAISVTFLTSYRQDQ
jgi:hypothetical protein